MKMFRGKRRGKTATTPYAIAAEEIGLEKKKRLDKGGDTVRKT